MGSTGFHDFLTKPMSIKDYWHNEWLWTIDSQEALLSVGGSLRSPSCIVQVVFETSYSMLL